MTNNLPQKLENYRKLDGDVKLHVLIDKDEDSDKEEKKSYTFAQAFRQVA
jgi:hypothetical protein